MSEIARLLLNFFTAEPIDCDDFDGDDEEVDLRAYQVVGGIFHFDLLNLPPQPKTVNTWIITQSE